MVVVEASALQAPPVATRGRASIGLPFLRLRSDDQLVELFRAGHEDAFRAIHDRYNVRLFAYARQMLPSSRQDAEDVLQDVFVRAYAGLRTDDRQLALRAWLYRVAHNRCIDQIRRQGPISATTEDAAAGPTFDPIAAAEQREALRRLIIDVQRLPEQQRSALLMRELSGMSYADLAAAMSLSVPAVKSLLVRARVSLAASLEARETACEEIRCEIVDCHDRGVRPTATARRHLRDCPGCREFRASVRGISAHFAALTPAVGPLALLAKFGVSAGSGGAAGGGSAAGGGGAVAAGGGAAAAGGGALAAGGVIGTGGAVATGFMTTTAGHVAAVLAAAVVAAGGAVELPHALNPPSHAPRAPHVHVHVLEAAAKSAAGSAVVAATVPQPAQAAPVTIPGAARPAPGVSARNRTARGAAGRTQHLEFGSGGAALSGPSRTGAITGGGVIGSAVQQAQAALATEAPPALVTYPSGLSDTTAGASTVPGAGTGAASTAGGGGTATLEGTAADGTSGATPGEGVSATAGVASATGGTSGSAGTSGLAGTSGVSGATGGSGSGGATGASTSGSGSGSASAGSASTGSTAAGSAGSTSSAGSTGSTGSTGSGSTAGGSSTSTGSSSASGAGAAANPSAAGQVPGTGSSGSVAGGTPTGAATGSSPDQGSGTGDASTGTGSSPSAAATSG